MSVYIKTASGLKQAATVVGPRGVTPRGAWAAATPYNVDDLVTSGTTIYRRIIAGTTATTPASDPTNWEVFLTSTATTDASLLTSGTLADARFPSRLTDLQPTATADLNTAMANGWYRAQAGSTNTPTSGAFMALVLSFDASNKIQFAYDVTGADADSKSYVRRYVSGAWQAWQRTRISATELAAFVAAQLLGVDRIQGNRGAPNQAINIQHSATAGTVTLGMDVTPVVASAAQTTAKQANFISSVVTGVPTATAVQTGDLSRWYKQADGAVVARVTADGQFQGSVSDGSLPTRLGTAAKVITDWNAITEVGFYQSVASVSSNAPNTGNKWFGIVEYVDGATQRQVVWSNAGATYRRMRNAAAWESWALVQDTQTLQDARYLQASSALDFMSSKGGSEVLNSFATTTGNVAIDLSLGAAWYASASQTAAVTPVFSNPPATGRLWTYQIEYSWGATPYAVNLPTGGIWSGGIAPTPTASKKLVVTYQTRDGGTTWYCSWDLF